MPRDHGADDDLRRWAASRAPSLLARAEAEAVAVLRDALVTAAAAGDAPADRDPSRRRAQHAPAHTTPASAPEQGELLWAYCVLRSSEVFPAELLGVAPGARVQPVRSGDLVALVSPVPRAEFGAEPLRRNLNDIAWLERVARAHEGVLDAVLQTSTIVPVRMCTLYENAEGVRRMLEREADSLREALASLDGRWEWAVKVLADEERLMSAAQAADEPPRAADLDRHGRGEGGAYMLRRRLERRHRQAANDVAAEVAEHVHARLQDWALDAVTRPAQNRELSGHDGAMLLNAAYLVAREREEELRELVSDLAARHAELGVRIELTGPWPPYNFVPAVGSTALA